jgi:putative FmdB family regulatory protein
MPIYEYHCSKCGDFETMQKMSDKPLTQCPTCRRKVTKLISSTTFQLKGSGWYVTDYARKGDGGGRQERQEGRRQEGRRQERHGRIQYERRRHRREAGKTDKADKSASKKSEKAAVA